MNKSLVFFIIFSLLLISNQSFANDSTRYEMYAHHIQKPIHLDGKLDEQEWSDAKAAEGFTENFPIDTIAAKSKTRIKILYDDDNVYIGVWCENKYPGKFVVQSFKRDFENKVNDMIAVAINPSADRLNGYNFSVSPMNVQREGTIEEGGLQGVTTAWDTKWHSETFHGEGFWSAEMRIPVRSMRFDSTSFWRVNFARNDLKIPEASAWVPVPRQINISSLSNTGKLYFDDHMPKPRNNIVLLPFATWNYSQDKDGIKNKPNAGVGLKYGMKNGLTLDLTYNPDFSQVEVDRQVTNLTRFNIFYPEQRNFFIENGDLFARFGFSRIRPFFSRRIGLDDKGNAIPILYGARLSGKPNEDWRIGVLSAQTMAVPDRDLLAQNYFVAAAQRRVTGRSNIAFMTVNRQSFDKPYALNDYNRLLGVDYNLSSLDNRWQGKVFVHQTLQPKQAKDAWATAAWINYTGRNWTIAYNHEYVGENYKVDAGFLYRKNYLRFEDWAYYSFYPKSKRIFSHGPGVYVDWYVDKQGQTMDLIYRLQYKVNWRSTANFVLQANQNELLLKQDFDASGKFSDLKYNKGERFSFKNIYGQYVSDGRKRLRYTFTADYGGYFSGTKFTGGFDLSYRFPPYLVLSVNYERNEIRLPQAYNSGYYDLLGTKIELTMTRNLFWTTYVQYNSQMANVNVNSRIQWRYSPVSDVFLVFTSNHTTAEQKNKPTQYVVLKWTYWFDGLH